VQVITDVLILKAQNLRIILVSEKKLLQKVISEFLTAMLKNIQVCRLTAKYPFVEKLTEGSDVIVTSRLGIQEPCS
jgi:hypothetical protein